MTNFIEIRDGRQEQAALRPEGINRASFDAYSMKSLAGLDQSPSAAAISNLPNLQLFDSQLPGTANNTAEFPSGQLFPQQLPSEGSTFSASQLGNDIQSFTNSFLNNGASNLNNLVSNGPSELGNLLNSGPAELGNMLGNSTSDLGNALTAGTSDLGNALTTGTSDLNNLLSNGASQFSNAVTGAGADLPTPPSPSKVASLLQTGLSNPIQGLEDTFKSIF